MGMSGLGLPAGWYPGSDGHVDWFGDGQWSLDHVVRNTWLSTAADLTAGVSSADRVVRRALKTARVRETKTYTADLLDAPVLVFISRSNLDDETHQFAVFDADARPVGGIVQCGRLDWYELRRRRKRIRAAEHANVPVVGRVASHLLLTGIQDDVKLQLTILPHGKAADAAVVWDREGREIGRLLRRGSVRHSHVVVSHGSDVAEYVRKRHHRPMAHPRREWTLRAPDPQADQHVVRIGDNSQYVAILGRDTVSPLRPFGILSAAMLDTVIAPDPARRAAADG
jgi:hypothetical protein